MNTVGLTEKGAMLLKCYEHAINLNFLFPNWQFVWLLLFPSPFRSWASYNSSASLGPRFPSTSFSIWSALRENRKFSINQKRLTAIRRSEHGRVWCRKDAFLMHRGRICHTVEKLRPIKCTSIRRVSREAQNFDRIAKKHEIYRKGLSSLRQSV